MIKTQKGIMKGEWKRKLERKKKVEMRKKRKSREVEVIKENTEGKNERGMRKKEEVWM